MKLNDAAAVYVGANSADAVYLGDALVWSAGAPACTITLTGAYAAAFGGSPADISGQTFSITSAGGAGSYIASTDLSAPTEISSGRRVAGLSAVSASAGTVTFLLLSSDAAKAVTATWSVSDSSWTFQTQSPAGVLSGFVDVAGAITDRIYLGVNADTGAGLIYRNGSPVSGGTIDTPLASIFSGKTQFALGGTGMPGAGQSFSGTILTNGADYVEGELPAGTLDWCGNELGAADPISILGDKLAAWYTSNPSTLFTTSTGETPVTSAGDPVGLRVNRVSGGPNASQATPTARPLWQTGPDRIVYDGVDDALQVTIPTGGWSGTFFNATTQGVIVGTYSVPAGTYQLPTNPLYRGSLNNDVGIVLCDGVASAEEIAKTVQWLRDNAGAGSGIYTGALINFFRDRTDITSLDASLINTSGADNFIRAFSGTGLKSLPDIDVTSSISFNNFCQASIYLEDVSAGFFDGCTTTSFLNAFLSTNLTETSIDNILVSIESNGTSGGTFNQSGGSAPSATGEAAIDALRLRGWTVTVTGGY